MYQYAELLSSGESIAQIQEEANESKKPKPLDDDAAIAAFIDQVNAASGSNDDPIATPDPVKPKLEEKKVVEKPEPKQESAEVQANTEAWAHALPKEEVPAAPAPAVGRTNASYNELFHAAAVQTSVEYDKTFDQLQQEDLKKAQDEKERLIEE